MHRTSIQHYSFPFIGLILPPEKWATKCTGIIVMRPDVPQSCCFMTQGSSCWHMRLSEKVLLEEWRSEMLNWYTGYFHLKLLELQLQKGPLPLPVMQRTITTALPISRLKDRPDEHTLVSGARASLNKQIWSDTRPSWLLYPNPHIAPSNIPGIYYPRPDIHLSCHCFIHLLFFVLKSLKASWLLLWTSLSCEGPHTHAKWNVCFSVNQLCINWVSRSSQKAHIRTNRGREFLFLPSTVLPELGPKSQISLDLYSQSTLGSLHTHPWLQCFHPLLHYILALPSSGQC